MINYWHVLRQTLPLWTIPHQLTFHYKPKSMPHLFTSSVMCFSESCFESREEVVPIKSPSVDLLPFFSLLLCLLHTTHLLKSVCCAKLSWTWAYVRKRKKNTNMNHSNQSSLLILHPRVSCSSLSTILYITWQKPHFKWCNNERRWRISSISRWFI